jgi:hypothetical protein
MKTLMVMLVGTLLFMSAMGCKTAMTGTVTEPAIGPDGKVIGDKVTSFTYQESNLARKQIAAGGTVNALKIVTSADPQTGSWFPTVIIGFGTFWIFDQPANCSVYFHDIQKSLVPYSTSMGSETTILIMGTDFGQKVEVANPALLIDTPIFKMFNPMADKAGVVKKPAIDMPPMPPMPEKK